MIKDERLQQFPFRLREAMMTAGYHSTRSLSGVNLQKLQEITGYSIQICRKYLRGEALPDVHKIIDIARYLNVSPGWLLFGEPDCQKYASPDYITIKHSVLLYLYQTICAIYFNDEAHEDIPVFLLSLTQDISEINATDAQLQRLMDLSLTSLKNSALTRRA